jgi:hypothetical protein
MDDTKLNDIASRIASTGTVRTAGRIEFVRDQGPVRRDIRAPGFKWSPDSMRDLAKVLWAVQRAHSYGISAYRIFSKINSSEFSPDGLLGGRGYIQSIKDMRSGLSQAVESLSSFSDTVHDELDADHWSEGQDQETDDLITDAEEVRAHPDTFVEGEYSDVGGDGENYDEFEDSDEEEEPVANPDPDDFNPDFESEEEDDFGQAQVAAADPLSDQPDYGTKSCSSLPSDESEQSEGKTMSEVFFHTTSPDRGSYSSAFNKVIKKPFLGRRASSLPVDTLPGPRVDHIGPGEGNEAGHYSDDDVWASDDPTGQGLSSGVQESNYLYEGPDADGISKYIDPTQGDSSVLASGDFWGSSEMATFIDRFASGMGSDVDIDFDAFLKARPKGMFEDDLDRGDHELVEKSIRDMNSGDRKFAEWDKLYRSIWDDLTFPDEGGF